MSMHKYVHKYTNRIVSIKIWGPVSASAIYADALIHIIDTQLKYTNSKVQIIQLESGDPCLACDICIFTNTIICPMSNTNRNDHTTGESRRGPSERPQLAAPCIFFHHYDTRRNAFIIWVVVEGVV